MSIQPSRYRGVAACLFTLLITALAYLNALTGPFQFDDKKALLYRSALHNLNDISGIIRFDIYLPRPLFYLSMATDWWLYGSRPFGFHLTNLIFHLIVTLLLFDVFRRLMKGDVLWAALGALLFGIHPAVTESVTYIWSRSSVMSAMFWLIALDCYIVSREGRGRWATYIGSLIAFIFALASKEIAATLPAMLLIWELVSRDITAEKQLSRLWKTAPFFALIALIMVARLIITGKIAFAYEGSYFHHLANQAVISIAYLKILLWPIHLSVDHFVPLTFSLWKVLLSLAILVIGVFFCLRPTAYSLQPVFCIGWFLITLAPFFLIPLRDQMVERNLYYPAMAFALFVALGLKQMWEKSHRAVIVAAAVMLVSYFAGTVHRNHLWGSEKMLWVDAVRNSPEKARPFNYLGALYLGEGKFNKAQMLFEAALRRDANYPGAHHNIGVIAMRNGDVERAAYEFAVARANDPSMAEAFTNQAKAEILLGNKNKAQELLDASLKRRPDSVEALTMLADMFRTSGDLAGAKMLLQEALALNRASYEATAGMALVAYQEGRREEGMRLVAEAIRIDPVRPEAHRALGGMYAEARDWQAAAAEFEKALANDPRSRELPAELGIAYMRLKRWDDAKRLFIREMQIKPGDPEPLLRLASIEEARGNTEDAVRLYNRALMLDRKGRYSADVNQILKRLQSGEEEQEIRRRGR